MTATPNDPSRLEVGRVGTAALTVDDAHTAPRLGSGRAPVFATPAMVALMEAAAVACVEDEVAAGQETLGVHIDVEHIAPTPVGLEVTARAQLIERDGRRLVFEVEAHDGRDIIGRGRHVRIIVDSARFRAKADAKRAM
jgi:fluoroacetyl-CoA thioesterase